LLVEKEIPRLLSATLTSLFIVLLGSSQKRATDSALEVSQEMQALSMQKEAHLRLVIDTIPTMAWSMSPPGALDFVNQRWLDYTGLTLQQAVASPQGIIYPGDLSRIMEMWSVDMAAGRSSEYEIRLRRADGEYRWFLVRTVPLRDERGNIVKWYGTGADIEDRKRAEAALQQSELDLAEAQRVALIGSWSLDVASGTVRWSEELYRIFDVDKLAFDGVYASFLSRVHDGDRPHVLRVNAEARASGKSFLLEYRIKTRGGQLKHIREHGHASRDAGGAVRRLFGTAQDVTEQKLAENALRDSGVQLRALSRRLVELRESERTQLARELHDRVGQSLTALNINLSIMEAALPAQAGDELRTRLADSATLIESTVVAIRNVTSELHPPMLDDMGLAESLKWHARQIAARAGIVVAVRGPESGARPSPEIEIVLFRIAQEALNNVVKHANAYRVDIELKRYESGYMLSIEDDGLGFDSGNGRDTRRPGLGMVTMRERSHAAGGSFEVHSSPGGGTRLTVRIPD
jgi:PAS domain S-box-containing protein